MRETFFDTNDTVVQIGDREVRDVDPIIPDEMFERIRQGYMCIRCFQPFEAAFPEECTMPVCRFPVRKEQSLELLRLYAGVDKSVTEDPFEDEYERAEKKGIWVPPRR